jgi:hypothetical protein
MNGAATTTAALTAPLGDVSYTLAGLDGCTCSKPCGHSYRKRHERAQAGTAVSSTEDVTHCPSGNIWNPSCKRRGCKFCGPRWARNWELIFQLATDHYDRSVVMVAVTPPGEQRLPWDEEWCSHRRPHKHRGPSGCRVEERAAREWSETAGERYKLMRDAAQKFTRRQMKKAAGAPRAANIIGRVWEPQRRGVPHLHIVLGYGDLAERITANLFVSYVKAKASSEYDFGWVEQPWDAKKCDRDHVDENGRHVHNPAAGCRVKLSGISGAEAARYLVRYLTGRSKRKSTIRENVSHPNMPMSLIWLSNRLTNVEKGGTGMTMRTLRRARHLWACAKGRCDEYPRWKNVTEAVLVGYVCWRAFARRGETDEPPPINELLRLARTVEERFEMLPSGWWCVGQREQIEQFANAIALRLAGIAPDVLERLAAEAEAA